MTLTGEPSQTSSPSNASTSRPADEAGEHDGNKNPFRPFCSSKCKWIDLGRWLDGSYTVPGAPGMFLTGQAADGPAVDAFYHQPTFPGSEPESDPLHEGGDDSENASRDRDR